MEQSANESKFKAANKMFERSGDVRCNSGVAHFCNKFTIVGIIHNLSKLV